MPIKLLCVAGVRPNFMKLAPLVKALTEAPDFHPILVHTGQHYDETMSGHFFRDLGMPDPDYHLQVGSSSHAAQTAEIMKGFEPVVMRERPNAVVVVGDVNSTMACAVVAAKLHVPVVHVEAGLRSFDRRMPEEINRVITDAISDLLLITEESGRRNLLAEGIPADRIHLVGNLMIDSLRRHLARARESGIRERLGVAGRDYGLLTLHRPSNVDEAGKLAELLEALAIIAREVPLIFPVHPRTRVALEAAALENTAGITMVEPLGYLDFLCLMSHSVVVLTDSGGIQEETTALGVPCLTLRDSTERPATVEEGTNLLAGTGKASILEAWGKYRQQPKSGRTPKYWDGEAAARCLAAIRSTLSPQQALMDQIR